MTSTTAADLARKLTAAHRVQGLGEHLDPEVATRAAVDRLFAAFMRSTETVRPRAGFLTKRTQEHADDQRAEARAHR